MSFNKVHFSSLTGRWLTPQSLLEFLYPIFGPFDLDPCSNALGDEANVKAAVHFTEAEDGLSREWHANVVFLNSPYGRVIGHWTRKAVEEVSAGRAKTVVCLLPARPGPRWFQEIARHASYAVFIAGRLRFGEAGSAPFDSVILVLGEISREQELALRELGTGVRFDWDEGG